MDDLVRGDEREGQEVRDRLAWDAVHFGEEVADLLAVESGLGHGVEHRLGADHAAGLAVDVLLADGRDRVEAENGDVVAAEALSEDVVAHPVEASLRVQRSHVSPFFYVRRNFPQKRLMHVRRCANNEEVRPFGDEGRIVGHDINFSSNLALVLPGRPLSRPSYHVPPLFRPSCQHIDDKVCL